MTNPVVSCGFVPLVDAAPLIIAKELGFAAQEGINLELHAQPSWSALRDKLAFGAIDAAHMLAPLPIAMSLGLSGYKTRIDVLSVLSMNGNSIGVSNALFERIQFSDVNDAEGAGKAVIAAANGKQLRIGVPFPFSTHSELVIYWMEALGQSRGESFGLRTFPPAKMSEAIQADEIDLFCVGEPWGNYAVQSGSAKLLIVGNAIWSFAPEKVLAARHEWIEANPALTASLMRAVWRAARWIASPENLLTLPDILAREEYVGTAPELIERALTGQLRIEAQGPSMTVPRFVEFFEGAATFPWRSQALWLAHRMASRWGVDVHTASETARASFRTDLYRANLSAVGAVIPGASEKIEGAIHAPKTVAAERGELLLHPDSFFDRTEFDPSKPIIA